jgi:hypothetical protein
VTPTPMRSGVPVVLDPDEAVDLTHLLDLIADWLRHAAEDTRHAAEDTQADLADFLDGAGAGRLAAAGIIATVEQTTLALHHRLTQATR